MHADVTVRFLQSFVVFRLHKPRKLVVFANFYWTVFCVLRDKETCMQATDCESSVEHLWEAG